jgi:uncharacterized phage protein gp47/JayE
MAIADLIYVDATGFNYPDFPTILERLKDEYRAIYGADVYLEPDSQDGQWVAIQASAISDTVQVAANVYNSFSPFTAQSDALTRNVKINGIARKAPTFSQADLTIIGQAATVITNGIAEDTLGQKWVLPATTSIPTTGEIVVTATAQQIGAVSALANTITKIATPTIGWQAVYNVNDAAIGEPIETDAELRGRQATSTMIPNLSILDGIIGSIEKLTGVTEVAGFANDSELTNDNLIPPHSISLVVRGGDSQDVADTIANKKSPGTGTFGTTSIVTVDARGVPNTIDFFRPTNVLIDVQVTLKALTGYTDTIGDQIKQSLADYLNNLLFGENVLNSKLYCPANLDDDNSAGSDSFDVTSIRTRRGTDPYTENNIDIAFFEDPIGSTANVTIILT